ncbi:hypothetical protein FACS189462_4900 [Spirochaetia bacterium]|nr:hypothetical protein FACS189462_4900 [Spirochaetia bacterium]
MDVKEVKEKTAGFFGKLPFGKLEEKIPASAREKALFINKAIPWANHIACVLIAVVLIGGIAACGGKKGGGGSDAGNIKAAAGATAGMVKGTGKNYTISKDAEFKYDLVKIDGQDYVEIQDVNPPTNFKKPEKVGDEVKIIDTLTVKIPEKIEGYTVGAIGEGAFDNPGRWGIVVVSVTIPDTVVEIGELAFRGSSISTIKLPKNLKKLGKYAFSGCKNLGGSITIPAGITEIPDQAFGGYFAGTAITEVIIPDSVTTIGQAAFYSCEQLASVKLPSHPIKYLTDPNSGRSRAFMQCGKLSLAVRNAIKESGYTDDF